MAQEEGRDGVERRPGDGLSVEGLALVVYSYCTRTVYPHSGGGPHGETVRERRVLSRDLSPSNTGRSLPTGLSYLRTRLLQAKPRYK